MGRCSGTEMSIGLIGRVEERDGTLNCRRGVREGKGGCDCKKGRDGKKGASERADNAN